MSNRTKITMLAVLALLVGSVIVAVQPVWACDEGCTPGFWKQEQHFQYWPDEVCTGWGWRFDLGGTCDPQDLGDPPQEFLVQDLFDIPECLLTDGKLDLNGDGAADTLLDALSYQGGDDVAGKTEILLRAAVAGVLNGQTMLHMKPAATIDRTNRALVWACDSGRLYMLVKWGKYLDDLNNQYCVFSP